MVIEKSWIWKWLRVDVLGGRHGHEKMVGHDLIPLMLDMMQDTSMAAKREVIHPVSCF